MKKLLVILLLSAFGFAHASSLDSYLKKELSGYKFFTYKIMSLPANIKSVSDKRLIIDSGRRFRMTKRFAYVPVIIRLTNSKTSRAFITVKLKLYADVFVSTRNIKRDENISADDFRVEQKEISGLNKATVGISENLSAYRAEHTITKGSFLDASMLSKIPVVYRGDNLQAYAVFGSVVVNFGVVAKEDGGRGDVIRVTRSDNQLFKAKIIDNKKVKIVE